MTQQRRFFQFATGLTAALALSLGASASAALALPSQPPESVVEDPVETPHLSISAVTMTPVPGGVTVSYRYDLMGEATRASHGLMVNGRFSPVGAGEATAGGTNTVQLALPVGSHTIEIYSSAGVFGNGPEIAQHSQQVTVDLGVLQRTAVPAVTGTAQVGKSLAAVPGTWDAGVGFAHQWKRNGAPIAGATGASYVVAPADRGTQLTVTVTGSKAGFASVTKTSTGTRSVTLGTLTSAPVPTVSGTAKVAGTLTAKPGAWDAGVAFSYRWYANGALIAGQKNATLTLAAAHRGKTITAEVTGAKTGFVSVVRTSAATAKIS